MSRIEKIVGMLADNPADCFLQHALALKYIKLGDDEKAKDLFMDLLSSEPGYTGSYYHLAKLLERNDKADEAIKWYEKGMDAAKKAGDHHSFNELRAAYEELTF